MTIYSYKIPRDFGFAPNPFYSVCTLATCKPGIRQKAVIGDWILGFGSSACGSKLSGKIIYAMKVEKKITFDEYWQDTEYQVKKPVMNGSLKQNYGDNIYHTQNGEWLQDDSHHSLSDGSVNKYNLEKDTSSNNVLISRTYWYFGKKARAIPVKLKILKPKCRNYCKNDTLDTELEQWLKSLPEKGFIGEPAKFSEEFKRYDGKS